MSAGINAPEEGERRNHANGSVPAHAKHANIVEVENAGCACRVRGREQQCTNQNIGSAGFVDDGLAKGVVHSGKERETLGQGAIAEVWCAGDDGSGWFPAGMRVDHVDSARIHRGFNQV
jgi:hypothetical protein